MLPQRPEVGQGQLADPQRPVPPADPDERFGRIQGELTTDGMACTVSPDQRLTQTEFKVFLDSCV